VYLTVGLYLQVMVEFQSFFIETDPNYDAISHGSDDSGMRRRVIRRLSPNRRGLHYDTTCAISRLIKVKGGIMHFKTLRAMSVFTSAISVSTR